MGLKIIIDMNLSLSWIHFFQKNGIEAIHWSSVGDFKAEDSIILDYAKTNDYIIFTNDLDFGAILAASKSKTPSVIQIRTQDVLPNSIGDLIITVLKQYELSLEIGALVSIDEARQRVRILPIK